MHHELLLAGTLGLHRRSLNRRQGPPKIPRHTVISDERTFKLAPDISFIDPTERMTAVTICDYIDWFASLCCFEHEFNKKSNSLYTILHSSRFAGCRRAPFLRRFLLRLKFNSFSEATARGIPTVVRPRPALQDMNQQ